MQPALLHCPQCHGNIHGHTVTCPHCGAELKAYGHPGMAIHRSPTAQALCQTCTYHTDDSCDLPNRPLAQDCTLYSDLSQLQEPELPPRAQRYPTRANPWFPTPKPQLQPTLQSNLQPSFGMAIALVLILALILVLWLS
jgi:hypothetical protein